MPQTTHGGSMRYIVARNGEYEITKNIEIYENKEKKIILTILMAC